MASSPVHVRFAHAPATYLHAGHARQAIVNVLFARAQGGRMTLRIDDTLPERGRPEFEAAIEQDLAWLGITWDARLRQSDRLARYAECAETLKRSGRLYPCFESEEELAAKRALRIKRKLLPVYDRAMLALTPAQRATAEANGKTPYWRFRLSDGVIGWDDLVHGAREVPTNTISDPILIRADGTPLPMFASIVDDLDCGITHIIRGEDHGAETPAQLDLFRLLAPRTPLPRFGHLPLITDMAGEKNARRGASVSLRSFRRDGIEPMALAAYLARIGSRRDPEPLTLAELAGTLTLEAFARVPPRFDAKLLLALNRRILRSRAYQEVADRLPEGATEAFWNAIRQDIDLLGEARLWWEVVQGSIDPPDLPEAGPVLAAARQTLPPDPWDETTWRGWLAAIGTLTGLHGKALTMPLRLALTGDPNGPDLAALLPLIGRALVASRLERGG